MRLRGLRDCKNYIRGEIDYAVEAMEAFTNSVDALIENNSLYNAREAQWKSMEAWGALITLSSAIGHVRDVTDEFIKYSRRCIAALKTVNQEDLLTIENYGVGGYIPLLMENVKRRLKSAEKARANARVDYETIDEAVLFLNKFERLAA